MALDGTYGGLKASVASFLARTDNEVIQSVPDFITMAHSQINDLLAAPTIGKTPREMLGRASSVFDDEFEALPADFLKHRTVWIQGATTDLGYVEPEEIVGRKARYCSENGDIQVYSVVGYEFQFWPAPTSAVQAELTYTKRITPLVADADSNWLLTLHPGAYLYGALIHAAPFLKDDERIPVWKSLFADKIQSMCLVGASAQTAAHLGMSINQSVV